ATRKACADGLKEFGVESGKEGPPVIDERFFAEAERKAIVEDCYELLLIDANALARPLSGDSAEERQDKARRALALLDQADKLMPETRTKSGLVRRAAFLRQAGDAAKAKDADDEADGLRPTTPGDYFLVGLQHFLQDDFKEALPLLNTAQKNR